MFKDYIKYRKDCKVAKREFTKMAVTTLPLINKLTKKSSEIGNFLLNLVESAKGLSGDALYEVVISEIANLLKTNESRLIEILTYMATLSPEDMQKILVHSVVESNDELSDVE